MVTNLRYLLKMHHTQRGASAVEYGLVVGLIAVAVIVVLGTLGGGIEELFDRAAREVVNAAKDDDAPSDP